MRLSLWWISRIRVHRRALFFTPRSVAHLERGRLGLSLQDVTLQILRGAQRSHAWTAARTVQPALLCELHHIVLLGQMSQRLHHAVPHMCLFMLNCQWTTQKCCWSPSKQAESDFRGNNKHSPGCSWPRWRSCYFSAQREADCSPTPAASDELLLLSRHTWTQKDKQTELSSLYLYS